LGSRHLKLDNYRGRPTVCASLIALGFVLIWQFTHNQSTLVNDAIAGESLSEEVDLSVYRPFVTDNKLVRVQPPPALRFKNDEAPRLDKLYTPQNLLILRSEVAKQGKPISA
jgi:hypothetical protein